MINFSKFPDKPNWAIFLDNLSKEELAEHRKKVQQMVLDKKNCNCGNDTVTHEFFCTDCWKRNPKFKYIWIKPQRPRDKWLLLDEKMYLVIRVCDKNFNPIVDDSTKIYRSFLFESRGHIWSAMRSYFYYKQNGKCSICKEDLNTRGKELHHKLARKEGGFEFYDNMEMLCIMCHRNTDNYGRKQWFYTNFF